MIALEKLDNILIVGFNRHFFLPLQICAHRPAHETTHNQMLLFIWNIIMLYFSYCSGNVSCLQIGFQKNRFMSK